VVPPEAAQSSPSHFPSDDGIASILLVEDDPSVAEIVATALRGRGHQVEIATTGRAALEQASLIEPDVVFLDLGLPDIDGIEVCGQLRRWFRNPILVLSADGDEDRKIAALDEGADDYVTKPFSMGELLARLRVALRHRGAVRETMDPAAISIGDLHIDTGAHVATAGDAQLELTRKEFAVLAMLARNCGRILTQAALLSRVWGTTDLAKSETLRIHITQLRKKVGEGARRPRLLTEPGVGYRMVAPDV
jgi:two-component system, OmpR family, KDP operon response regulator KdpE